MIMYGYDDDAQLAASQGYTSGGSPIANERLGFLYDPGWNMTNRSVNETPTAYTLNDLNEVTSDGTDSFSCDANGLQAATCWDIRVRMFLSADYKPELDSLRDSLPEVAQARHVGHERAGEEKTAPWMCGSSPRPIATYRSKWKPGAFGRIVFIV